MPKVDTETLALELKKLGYRKTRAGFGTHQQYTHTAAFDTRHQAKVTRALSKLGFTALDGVLPAWEKKDIVISKHNKDKGGHHLWIH